MKRKWLYPVLAVVVVVGLVVTGCAKPTGPAGPTGPTGPTGPAAPTGPVGPGGYTAAAPLRWDWNTYSPRATGGKFVSMEWGIDWIKEKTNGAWIITPYYGTVLAPAAQNAELLGAGLYQMSNYAPSYVSAQLTMQLLTFIPHLAIMEGCPDNAGASWEHDLVTLARKCNEQENLIHLSRVAQLEASQMNILNLFGSYVGVPKGVTGFTLKDKKVMTLEDFKGLNVRCSGLQCDLATLVGANPVGISWADIEEGFKKGLLNCIFGTSGISLFRSRRFDEYAKYECIAPIMGTCSVNGANMDAWNALPEEFQQIYREMIPVYIDTTAKATRDELADDFAYAKEKGIEWWDFPDAELIKFWVATAPVFDVWYNDAVKRGKGAWAKEQLDAVIAKHEELTGKKFTWWKKPW